MSKTFKTEAHGGAAVYGHLRVEIHEAATGKLLKSWRKKNMVVDSGLRLLRDLIGGDAYKAPTHMWIGTNDTAPAASDTTATITDAFEKAITARVQNAFGISFQLFINESEANGFTYKEAALVNSRNDVETLFSRILLLPDIEKTALITITLTWEITIGRAA